MTFHALGKVVHLFGNFLLIIDTSGALKEAGVKIKHITRVCFTTGRTAKNQRNLAVCNSLLRQVVIYNQCIKTAVAEVFANGCACKRSIILHGCRVGCRCTYNNGIRHSSMLTQGLHESSYRTCLLANGNIDAIYRLSFVEILFLVDNGINCNSCFTRLAVANNQLALPTADRNHRVYSLQTGLQRFLYRLAIDYPRGLTVQRHFESIGQIKLFLTINSFT